MQNITTNHAITYTYHSFITTHSSQKSRACKLYFCAIFQFFFFFCNIQYNVTQYSFVHDKLTSLIINLSGEWLPTSKNEWPELGSKETVSLRNGGGRQSIKKKDYVYNDGISSSLLEIFIKMLLINSLVSYCSILMLFSRIERFHHDVINSIIEVF